MWTRHAIVLLSALGFASAAGAQAFRIEDTGAPANWNVADLKPGTVEFNDRTDTTAGADSASALIPFDEWSSQHPEQNKFLTLFPGYAPSVKPASDGMGPGTNKLYMYVAQARFLVGRAPGTLDLSRYVTLAFLEKIDPAIKHALISAADVTPFRPETAGGNENPDRKWCTGRATAICIQSTYKLEGKIPIGIMLVNKLRDSAKKVADHIDFQSELSAPAPADLDQDGLRALTSIDTPVVGVLEQNIFYVNEVLRFAKFFAVFQNHPTDADKTVVTAFMVLAIEGSTLDKKRGYDNVPVLRNLVPAQVLAGNSSFNTGNSISSGLPNYARNRIKSIAEVLENDKEKAAGN